MNNKKIVVDTNILLSHPEILDEDNIIIPFVALQELDRLKVKPETGFEARRAIRTIKESKVSIDIDFSEDTPNSDDLFLKCAQAHDAVLYTKDYCLDIKANHKGVEAVDPYSDGDGIYTGVREVILTDSQMSEMYQSVTENIFDLNHNQYLLVKNDSGIVVDRMKWIGNKLVHLKLPPSKFIKPLNDLQAFAIDLLNDQDIPIKIIAGTYGSGKTWLTARMGVYHVMTKGNYSKIMIVRNPIGAGEEIGFIKGDLSDKMAPFYKPIEQNLEGGELQLQQMIQYKQLEFAIPYYIKGQSINNAYMIVEEAEDMNKKLIKIVGTRVGEGTCICFSGDWQQAESKFIKDNGLIYLINKTKANPLVGTVVLNTDVRSSASKVFAELDS